MIVVLLFRVLKTIRAACLEVALRWATGRKKWKDRREAARSELSTSISEDMVRRCSSCVASDSFLLSSSAQDREPNYGRIRAYSVDRNMKNSYTIFMIIAGD
eukprot:scaffold2955_cov100-Skeletonema_dohrnii-CCMP3373.AAC.2